MTVIRPNGISGVTSITSSGDAINFYRSDGTLGPELGINVNVTSGVSTFAALNVTGVLTYEDVASVDSVGIITARSTIDAKGDISIADKIIHTGDTNTAIRFPAADTITAETSGSERLRIDSSGRLLLGTTTEGYSTSDDLTIATSGHTGMTIRSGTSNYGSIHFSDGTSGNAEYRGVIEYSHAIDSLGFYTEASEKMRINSSGDVGIGANNPLTRLHIDGTDGGESTLFITASDLDTNHGGTVSFGGNYDGTNRTSFSQIRGLKDNNTSGQYGGYLSFLTRTHGATPAERMRLTSNGVLNVGGDYTQTTSLVHLTGGNGGGGQSPILTLKHPNTTGSGDGPALLLNGYYSGNSWSFAKITSVNSGSGFGADLQIHVHPANSSQGASLVKAVSILGDGGSGANVTITDGNLKIGTSGHGIDFSSTGNPSGMTSELLDDYEEGTFTPAFPGTTSISPAPTGHYVRVGSKVTVWINITNATVGGTHNGTISDLPFSGGSHRAGGFSISAYGIFNTADTITALVESGQTNAYLLKTVANSAWSSVGISAGSNRYLHLTMTYEV